MVHIVFVCHGNICRSPMAEYIWRDKLQKAGIGTVTIDSAAVTNEEIGRDMYPPAKKKLREKGISVLSRRAKLFTRADYDLADRVFIMDENNRRRIERIVGRDDKGKICKLLTLVGEEGDVADPWYTGDFEKTYEDIEKCCIAWMEAYRGSNPYGEKS